MNKKDASSLTRFNINLQKTLRYFAFFEYAPTLQELYVFHRQKMTIVFFEKQVETLIQKKKIKKYYQEGQSRYTVGGYRKEFQISNFKFSNWKKRQKISEQKVQKAKRYIHILSWFPQIQLIGFSGSLSMMNAKKDDDIDLFIISKRDRLFTARFIGLVLAFLMGLKRKRNVSSASNKICLNLFFDEKNMTVPSKKRSEFVAHEVLQMKPVIDKNTTCLHFLYTNQWVRQYFPNVTIQQITNSSKRPHRKDLLSVICYLSEYMAKKIQLFIINRHKTTELITETQLWFFPDDFERKVSGK